MISEFVVSKKSNKTLVNFLILTDYCLQWKFIIQESA